MNYIDLLLALPVIWAAYGGWRTGFILGAFGLARWVTSLLLGLWLYQYVARFLEGALGGSTVWMPVVSFILTMIAVGALLRHLERRLLEGIAPETHRTPVNRALGVIPGAVNGLIIAAVLASLLLAMPLPEPAGSTARESSVANALAASTDRLEDALAPAIDPAIARTLNRLTTAPVKPGESEMVKLPFTVARPRPRPDLEAEMLTLVNRERREAGLRPLVADTALRTVARAHSTDMFGRGYFSHHTPEGRSPFDRIGAARIRYRTAGENLALAPTLTLAHTGLMNSPGHRANILRPAFGRVGIGIMDGGIRGVMVTQNFRN